MLPAVPTGLHTYFENAVGRLLEHPKEHYILVEYLTGPRQLRELQAFLTHAGQLLAQHGWDRVQQQGTMPAFTPAERTWLTAYWATKTHQPADLYAAMLLPHDVFAHLSYQGRPSPRPSTPLPSLTGILS
jgi:hypothetical protein